jgi:hypothetical protein
MNEETLNNIETPGRIPLKERNDFQAFLEQKMIGQNPVFDAEVAWANQYAKEISDIIDNVQNTEIRELIMKNNFEGASQKVLELLKIAA